MTDRLKGRSSFGQRLRRALSMIGGNVQESFVEYPAPTDATDLPVSARTQSQTQHITRQALRGSAILASRGLLVRVIGLGSNLLIARALAPKQFGLLAVGFVLIATGTVLSEAGMGAALVRGERAPSRGQLDALLSFQLGIGVLAVLLTTAAVWAGWTTYVSAIMSFALPLLAFRTGSTIICERRLSYGPVAITEFGESVLYLFWVTGVTLLHGGVYGYAYGVVVRALGGSVLLALLVPEGLGRPTFNLRPLRPIFNFGIKFQGVTITGLVRDQGVNALVLGLGGSAQLGLWALAFRLMQGPYALFESLWRVSFPALARLRAAGQDVTDTLRTGFSLCCSAASLVLIPVMASSPWAVGTVFGDRWRSDGWVLELGCVGLLIGGPLSVVTAGHLYAKGEAGKVMLSAIAHTVTWLTITACFLRPLGVLAVGIGWAVTSSLDGGLLAWLSRDDVKIPIWRVAVPTWLIAFGSVFIGMVGTTLTHEDSWLGILISIGIALPIYCLLQAIRRDPLLSMIGSRIVRLARSCES